MNRIPETRSSKDSLTGLPISALSSPVGALGRVHSGIPRAIREAKTEGPLLRLAQSLTSFQA